MDNNTTNGTTNSNTVKNQKQEVPCGIELNDEDYLNCVLTLEKNMTNNYSIVLNEVSNSKLYRDLFAIFRESKDMQRDLFNLLFKKGWYELEKAEQTKVDEKYQTFSQKLQNIDKTNS